MHRRDRHHLKKRLVEEEDEADAEDNSEDDAQFSIQAETLNSAPTQHSDSLHHKDIFRKKTPKMEGEHRISSIAFIRFSPLKSAILCCLLTVSVVGLLLLQYSKKFRRMVLYEVVEENRQATHIFIRGQEGYQQISKIERVIFDQKERVIFFYKELRYQVHGHSWQPVSYPYVNEIEKYFETALLADGLSKEQAERRAAYYGKNQHLVSHPSFLRTISQQLANPLFIYLLFYSVINFLEGYYQGFVLVGLTVLSVIAKENIKTRVKKEHLASAKAMVKVMRDGVQTEIHQSELAPGDIFFPEHSIPCDALLLRGQIAVNEGPLTGQTFTQFKVALPGLSKIYDKSHWILEGSEVISVQANTLAVSVHGGFGTRRGRAIRNQKSGSQLFSQLQKRLLFFQIEALCLVLVLFVISLWRMQHFQVDSVLRVFRLIDFVGWAFPPALLLVFNLADICCLLRLSMKNVRIYRPWVAGGRLKTLCFDKTGTLTLDSIQLQSIFTITAKQEVQEATERGQVPQIIIELLATCHSIELAETQLTGNSIDLSLFQYSGAAIQPHLGSQTRTISLNGSLLEVIRVNPYSSQFQTVSALVRAVSNNSTYVFVKGNPEELQSRGGGSLPFLDSFIKRMGFKGCRVLGLGVKQISADQIQINIAKSRREFQSGIQMVGLVTLKDEVREEAKDIIRSLAEREVSPKIITGDNIYSAARVAYQTGIIPQSQKLTVVQGHNYDADGAGALLVELTFIDGTIKHQAKKVDWFSYNSINNEAYAIDYQFMKKNPHHFFHDKVKIYARVPPQEKPNIIHKYKQHFRILVANQRIFEGEPRGEVGMVGDGTNDRMALQAADLAIALEDGDAKERAHFSVTNLSCIGDILNESKQNEYNSFRMVKYLTLSQLVYIVSALVLEEDCTFFTSAQMLLSTLLVVLVFLLGMAAESGDSSMAKWTLSLNVFTLRRHLLYWGPFLLIVVGMVTNAIVYSESSGYSPNDVHPWADFESGWFGETKSATMAFLTVNVVSLWLILVVELGTSGKPIKKKIVLIVIFLLELTLIGTMSFWGDSLSWMGLQPISGGDVGLMWGITGASGVGMVAMVLLIVHHPRNEKKAVNVNKDSLIQQQSEK